MKPNAYLCETCGHHENDHHARNTDCVVFMPGNCGVCAGFGCADCSSDARKGRHR